MYPAPGIVERIGPDWDWIWLDGQHGQLGGYTEMLAMVRACNLIQRPAFVRIPGQDPSWISLALDMNADAVIVPQVDSAEEAAKMVQSAKFPPLGDRSYGGRRPIDFKGRTYCEQANGETLLVCQIESLEALQNADAIAAVPGVDALFLGPDDLFLRKGAPMDAPRDEAMLADALRTVVEACRAHGKKSITVGTGPLFPAIARYGFDYLVGGGDVPFLAGASKTASDQARAALAETPSPKVTAPTSGSPY